MPSPSEIPEPDGGQIAEETFSLTELAEASGVTERTVRYYQGERLLPKPEKNGRDSVYRSDHLKRIQLIVELRDRGLTLGTIRELVVNDNPARTVATWLGIDATLSAPWSDDRPRILRLAELRELVADPTPGVLADLQDGGYTIANPDGTWTVPSPALLDLALQLQRAGIEIEIAGHIRDLLRRRLARTVDDTVSYLVKRAGSGFAGTASPDELSTAIGALRPIAREMSSLILAQEVERALTNLVESRPRDLTRSRRH